MADDTPRRHLVRWSETVTHEDVVWVSDAEVRQGLFTEQAWAALSESQRRHNVTDYLDRVASSPESLNGTRRMRTVGREGVDVVDSCEWPDGAPEPKLVQPESY